MDALKIEHLKKSYGRHTALHDLNLHLESGECFGLIGPNGAGKSTAIRSVLGLILPEAGTIEVFGLDARTHRKEVLTKIGFMPSESFFYGRSRVKDMLHFSAGLHRKDCSKMADALCRRLQLDQNARVDTLSLGNRKKLSIVCALQHEPDLLILDEPTSGRDPLIRNEFYSILEEMQKQGKTIFLSSHNLNEVSRCCSRAGFLKEGRLIACDTLDNLKGTRSRKVIVRGEVDLSGLKQIQNLQQEQGVTSFLYDGSPVLLMKALANFPIEDVLIEEPDLEEIFLHDYQSKEDRT